MKDDNAEREQGRDTASEADRRGAAILESITDGFIALDADWRFIYVNAEAERINGMKREEMIGKSHWEVFPAAIGTAVDREFRRAVAERISVDFENYYQPWDRWFAVKAYPARDGGLSVFYQDITERKRAVQQLAESEETFRTMADSIPQLAWMARPDGHIFWYNQQWYTYTGTTPEQMEGWGWRAVHDPAMLPEVMERWKGSIASGEPFDMEFPIRGADGVFRPFLTRVNPVKDASGRVARWFGSNTDVSERKQAEAERLRLAAQAERQARIFDTALSNTPDFIYIFDLAGRFTYANKALLALWQKDLDEAIGKNFHDLGYPPELAERLQCQIQHVVATKERVCGETPYTGALGERFYEYIFVPLLKTDGGVEAVVGSTRDITERKRTEETLHRQAEELQDADRRKDEFLAMLAHELRNPLASIGNASNLLRRPDAAAEHVEWSKEVIERQVRHLARLIDDLLDVSRITRGKIELRKERIDASPVINSAVDVVRPLVEEKKQDLSASFSPGTLWCEVDPTRLEQILINLLTNAARYTEAGGHIRLSARHDGEQIVFKVRDTGVGIPPERLPEMFELFVQGDRTMARSEGGLGIGLTIVKRIAEMHGGGVTASSDGPGKGSEFTVTLPAVAQPKPAAAAKAAAGRLQARSSRILIVDDNDDTARSLSRLLTLLGNEIHTAHDGPSAIADALIFRPEFILLDIGLPGMDGYQVARRLRQEGLSEAVIIAVSGYGQEEDRRRSSDAGFDHHLVKPVDYDALVMLIGQPIA